MIQNNSIKLNATGLQYKLLKFICIKHVFFLYNKTMKAYTIFWWNFQCHIFFCFSVSQALVKAVEWNGSCSFTNNNTCGYKLQGDWYVQEGEFYFHRPVISSGSGKYYSNGAILNVYKSTIQLNWLLSSLNSYMPTTNTNYLPSYILLDKKLIKLRARMGDHVNRNLTLAYYCLFS